MEKMEAGSRMAKYKSWLPTFVECQLCARHCQREKKGAFNNNSKHFIMIVLLLYNCFPITN